MNGAVFQTSAMMMMISACGSEPSQTVDVPRTVFTKPYGDTNIVRHMIAVTTVSTAHGTSTTVRSRPCPRNASCMAIAMRETDQELEEDRHHGEDQRVLERRPPGGVAAGRSSSCGARTGPPSVRAPRLRTLYSCSESQIGVDDRPHRDDRDEDHRRRDHQHRQAALRDSLGAPPLPVRPAPDRGGFHRHQKVDSALLIWSSAFLIASAGTHPTGKRVVDVLVDRLRDLRIHRRDRPGLRLAEGLLELGRVRDGLLHVRVVVRPS